MPEEILKSERRAEARAERERSWPLRASHGDVRSIRASSISHSCHRVSNFIHQESVSVSSVSGQRQ